MAKKPRTKIGPILRKWRDDNQILTMAAAARMLGIPYRTYQDWELGNREPRPSVRGMLTQVLTLHAKISETAEKRLKAKKSTR